MNRHTMWFLIFLFTRLIVSGDSKAAAPLNDPDLSLQACKADYHKVNLSNKLAMIKFASGSRDVKEDLDILFTIFVLTIDPDFLNNWEVAQRGNDKVKIKELEGKISEFDVMYRKQFDADQQVELTRKGMVSESRRLASVLRSDAEMGSITRATIEKYRLVSKEVKELPTKYSGAEVFLSEQDIENLQRRADAQKGKGLNASESCTPVDLHDSPVLGPIRDQGQTGWCYAMTLSDLISQKFKRRVQPVALALHYNLDRYDEDIRQRTSRNEFVLPSSYQHKNALEKQGGTFKHAFVAATSRWLCVDEGSPFFLENPGDFRLLCDFWILSRSKQYYDNLITGQKSREAQAFACKTYQYMHKALFHNLTAGDFLSALSRASADEFADQLVSKVCKKKINPAKDKKLPRLAIQSFERDSMHSSHELLNLLDAQLGKKNISAIGVNVKVFSDPSASTGGETTEDTLHAVTVVGRKFDPTTKECFYLIRNSWGADWKPKYQGPESLGLMPGYAWVSARDLARNVDKMAYLE